MSSFMNLSKVLLGIICVVLLITVSIKSWRQSIRALIVTETPKVLSTIHKDYFDDGRVIVFAKVKTDL